MKILKILFGLIVLLVVAVIVTGLLLPSKTEVDRRIVIAAPRTVIHANVDNLSKWAEWTVWNQNNPRFANIEYSYEGPASGVGAIQSWKDPSGNGRLEITKSDLGKGVEYSMSFDGGEPWTGGVYYSPVEGKNDTEVSWRFEGEADGILMKIMMVIFRGEMEAEFDQGLQGLKKMCEEEAAAAAGAGAGASAASTGKDKSDE